MNKKKLITIINNNSYNDTNIYYGFVNIPNKSD